MSRFLDCLERISLNAPPPMGFGVDRGQKTPGMALICLISGDHAAGCAAVAELAPDAVLLSGIGGPEELDALDQNLPKAPWGVRSQPLTEGAALAFQEKGCDLLAFSLDGTSLSALSSDEVARVLCLDTGIDERQLRAIEPLPVDVLLLEISLPTGAWTLSDLAEITGISRRVDKYILAQVSQPPGKKDLEAIRKAGVHGLVLDVGSVSSESLSGLKDSLLNMPRPQPGRRGRSAAVVPSSVFSVGRSQRQEEPDEDDDE